MSDARIGGFVADGFEPVREAFATNFAEHRDVGAGFALYKDGELVVDLWGGLADPKTETPYGEDTLQLVFSTTKGATAMCAHLLAQRGLLDFDAPVTTYWPEFGQHGKENVPVRWLLSHRTGIPVIDTPITQPEVLAWDPIVEALAAQEPIWEPGTAHGYHALTYGWLVGEIVRCIDGRSIGQFFNEEIAGPLGLEFWIGLPDEQQARVAPLLAMVPGAAAPPDFASMPKEVTDLLLEMATAFLDPNSITNRALHLNGVFGMEGEAMPWNQRDVRAAQIPAANGVTNARSLARLYASCIGEVDGFRLLDDETVKRACEEQSNGRDQVLITATRFGVGFFLPSSFSPLSGPASFGHAGAGGSLGLADPEAGIGFGYVMNQMNANLSNDPRTVGLVAAVKACL